MHPFNRALILALLIVTVLVGPAAAGVLTKFTETRITIEAHRGLKTFGITKDSIKSHVVGWLQSNIPRLVIKQPVPPFIHISVLVQERSGFAYGYIGLRIVRKVTIKDINLDISGGVWRTGGIIISRVPETKNFVLQSIDQLLNRFADQWKRDNS